LITQLQFANLTPSPIEKLKRNILKVLSKSIKNPQKKLKDNCRSRDATTQYDFKMTTVNLKDTKNDKISVH